MSDFPGGSDGKSICLQCRRPGFDPWVGKIPWRRQWQPTPVLLLRKFHGWRSLVDYSPWGRKVSDMTERLHSLSLSTLCIYLCMSLCVCNLCITKCLLMKLLLREVYIVYFFVKSYVVWSLPVMMVYNFSNKFSLLRLF